MITPSNITIQQYNDDLALEYSTHARVTFVFENIVFEDVEFDYDGGIQVSSYMNHDTNLVFGSATSREAIIHFIRSEKTDNLNWTNEFKLEFGVDHGNSIEWITVGYFIGEKPVWDGERVIEFTAYDRMTRFDKPADGFIRGLTYPCTVQDIYDDLCAYCSAQNETGDEFASVMEHEFTSAPDIPYDISCRELLAMIAVANCSYAVISNDGYVKMRWFSEHVNDYQLTWDNCFNIRISNLKTNNKAQWKTLEPYQWKDLENVQYKYYDNDITGKKIPVKSVSVTIGEGEERVIITQPPEGSTTTWQTLKATTWSVVKQNVWGFYRNDPNGDGNEYIIQNNPFAYYGNEATIRSHLQTILNRLYGYDMSYVADIAAMGNWLVEDGDVIHFEVERNEPLQKFPVFNHVITWNGSCRCAYETTGKIQKEVIYI